MDAEFKILFISIFSGTCLLLSIIFEVIGQLMRRYFRRKLERCTYRTQAVVVANKRVLTHSDNHRYITYSPVLSYTVGLRKYEKVYSTSTPKPKYEIGEIINILCDYQKPEQLYIEGDNTLGIIAKVFIIVGAVMFAAAVIVGIVVALI